MITPVGQRRRATPLLLQKPEHVVKAGSCSTYRANSGACRANGGDAPRNSGAATKPPAFAYAVRCFHRRVRRQRGRLQRPRFRVTSETVTVACGRDRVLGYHGRQAHPATVTPEPHNRASRDFHHSVRRRRGGETTLPQRIRGLQCRPDGQFPCYEPVGRAFTMWNNDRGGQTTNLALRCFRQQHRQGAAANTNDFNPMWAVERVYFLSDRNGRPRLFVPTISRARPCASHPSRDWSEVRLPRPSPLSTSLRRHHLND